MPCYLFRQNIFAKYNALINVQDLCSQFDFNIPTSVDPTCAIQLLASKFAFRDRFSILLLALKFACRDRFPSYFLYYPNLITGQLQ